MNFIKDFEAQELDVFARLSETQLLRAYEPQPGLFLAESAKVINRGLAAGYRPVSLLVAKELLGSAEAEEILQNPLCAKAAVYVAEAAMLSKMVGYHLTGGLLCAMERKSLPSLDEVCAGCRRIAVLEDVVNPTNVGAIFRSAAALHMDAVVLSAGCSDPLYRRALRVSMGTVFQIPWTKLHKKEADLVTLLRNLGFQSVAMALRDDTLDIRDLRLKEAKKLAVFLGTEGDGLADSTIAACDYRVKIPMSHGVDSLNVAAASAVAFWELGK